MDKYLPLREPPFYDCDIETETKDHLRIEIYRQLIPTQRINCELSVADGDTNDFGSMDLNEAAIDLVIAGLVKAKTALIEAKGFEGETPLEPAIDTTGERERIKRALQADINSKESMHVIYKLAIEDTIEWLDRGAPVDVNGLPAAKDSE